MPTYHLRLSEPLPAGLGDELAKRVYYIAPGIDSFSLVFGDDRVVGVDLDTEGEEDPAALARKLDLVSRTEVLPQRPTAPEVVWTSPHPTAVRPDAFQELKRLGAVHEMGPGTVATGQLFTDVLDALDRDIRTIATEEFGAARYRYPALIGTAELMRGGYPVSFPQHVLTASHVRPDPEVYRDFVAGAADAHDLAAHIERHSGHAGYCLPPTMCFHTYVQLSGERLAEGTTVVTSRGKSFRYESRYHHSLERLWDFTIREVVFLGEAAEVARCRRGFLDAACEFVAELGLAGTVERAHDPFFGDATVPRRVLAQTLSGLKYELRLPVDDDRTVAAASFNLHGTVFGERYGITGPDGATVHTACVGFGLERLTFALFCRYGADQERWPAGLRARLLG